jgi:glycosyltransferase involved in cell wall biosynthesis
MSLIKVSLVVPALNEEITIGEFIEWCKEGLEKANVSGEILIIDSSTDKTPEIAESLGARVIRVPKRGLGQAYIDAIPEIKGEYVIMGDCDLTYDFREIGDFVRKLDEGYEFVMGTRMKGYIEKDAMPKLHRYFGTPLTTKILNVLYGSKFSDIHCGMRGITTEALKKISLESSSWEYASEMVLKAVLLQLNTTEVPIKFYKDREGRLSHMKRAGWLQPWHAGWINLRVMFEYTPATFLKIPGIIMFLIGIILMFLVLWGRVTESVSIFSLHWLLVGALLFIVGYSFYQSSILSEIYYGFNKKQAEKYRTRLSYNKLMLFSFGCGLLGVAFFIWFLNYFVKYNFDMSRIGVAYALIFSIVSFIIGFQTFTFALLFQMLSKKRHGQ